MNILTFGRGNFILPAEHTFIGKVNHFWREMINNTMESFNVCPKGDNLDISFLTFVFSRTSHSFSNTSVPKITSRLKIQFCIII